MFYLLFSEQITGEAVVAQRATAERERYVHLHAKREADRADRALHANAEARKGGQITGPYTMHRKLFSCLLLVFCPEYILKVDGGVSLASRSTQ